MKKYEITFKPNITIGDTIEIEAENEEQAHQEAENYFYDNICHNLDIEEV